MEGGAQGILVDLGGVQQGHVEVRNPRQHGRAHVGGVGQRAELSEPGFSVHADRYAVHRLAVDGDWAGHHLVEEDLLRLQASRAAAASGRV